MVHLLVKYSLLNGRIWCTYLSNIVHLLVEYGSFLVKYGALIGQIWCTYWSNIVHLLVEYGALIGQIWCTYWPNMVHLNCLDFMFVPKFLVVFTLSLETGDRSESFLASKLLTS